LVAGSIPASGTNFLAIMQPDLSLWGIYTMPLGLAICFGPVLLAWFKEEMDSRKKDNDQNKR
jgi:hypothetical protein